MKVMELLLRGNDEWHWGTLGGLAPRQAAEPHLEDASLHFVTSITHRRSGFMFCASSYSLLERNLEWTWRSIFNLWWSENHMWASNDLVCHT